MGLDILIWTDKSEAFMRSEEYSNKELDLYNKHSLSRTFCDLICRSNVIIGDTELEQIAKITCIDISDIVAMESYGSESGEELDWLLKSANSEEEKQEILNQAKQNKENLKGNIDKVLSCVNSLIEKLSGIHNLPVLLDDHEEDTLDNKKYFSDFNIDKGQGYIGNNFGQDMRNFKRHLEYAKSKGATTVYFLFG